MNDREAHAALVAALTERGLDHAGSVRSDGSLGAIHSVHAYVTVKGGRCEVACTSKGGFGESLFKAQAYRVDLDGWINRVIARMELVR